MENNILFTAIFFFFSLSLLTAQAPSAFNYQGEARQDGNIVTDPIDLRLSLIQGDLNGPVVYQQELSDVEPNAYGQFSVQWGKDQPGLDTVDWQNGPFFQRVEIRLDGGDYVDLGTSQLLSVPYAMYAEKAGGGWIENELDSSLHYLKGNIGIGTDNPTTPLHIIGNTIRLDGEDDADLNLNIPSVSLNNPEVRFLVDDEEKGHVRLKHQQEYLSIRENLSANSTQISLKNGKVGIGMISPSDPLDVKGLIRVRGDGSHQKLRFYAASSEQDNRINSYDENGDLMWQIMMGWRAEDDCFAIYRPGNNVPTEFKVDVNGMTHVRTLKIHGGADIKEDLNSIEQLEPGDIVVIDENNPGQIKRTNQPYDKKVAGIISGANGVKPGLSLSQEDVMEGEHPLTMLGRAYVKVTGKVEIGDMLTTSSIPGHAMAVKDYSKANGTVIGKAMTENEDGWVLVLVNLQ